MVNGASASPGLCVADHRAPVLTDGTVAMLAQDVAGDLATGNVLLEPLSLQVQRQTRIIARMISPHVNYFSSLVRYICTNVRFGCGG